MTSLAERYARISVAQERYKHQERLDDFFKENRFLYRAHDWEAVKVELVVLREIAVEHYKLMKQIKDMK